MQSATSFPQEAQVAFALEGLPFPPVPAPLAQALRQRGEFAYATREMPVGPYVLEHYVQEAIDDGSVADYAVAGFDGYGTNSWAAHYFLVEPALALFIQVPWGGAYTDSASARAELTNLFAWSDRLRTQMGLCLDKGCIAPGERLVVVASRFDRPGWCWSWPRANRPGPIDWNSGQDMFGCVERSIAHRLAGPPPEGVAA